MKLNLGCGEVKKDGYINVDIRVEVNPDVVWDLEVFPYPWLDNSIDEIYTSHTVEHIPYGKQDKMMREFFRILKPKGKLIILCPDIQYLFQHYIFGDGSGGPFGHPHLMLEHMIFGGQDYPDNFHKAGYTPTTMRIRLDRAGFRITRIERGLRAEAVKP